MGWGSGTTRRHVDLARIGIRIGDELGNSFGRNRWMYRYDVRLPVNACDRRDVADEIETKLVIECGVDGVPTADHEQRVAVRRCAHDRVPSGTSFRQNENPARVCLPGGPATGAGSREPSCYSARVK